MKRSVSGSFGFASIAIARAWGTSSESSSTCLGNNSTFMLLTPVRLPPGRARLATSPASTGSPLKKTIGIVEVAAFAASAERGPALVAIRSRRHIPASAVLRFAPMLLEVLAQGTVDIGLIALAVGPSRFEPLDHIGIDPQRDLPLDWPVQHAAARPRPIADLRHVAGIDLLLGQCGQHVQLGLPLRGQRFRTSLLHRPSARVS